MIVPTQKNTWIFTEKKYFGCGWKGAGILWTNSISLPVKKVTEQNENGFLDEAWEFVGGIPASFKDTTRADETLANQCGYGVDVIVEIMACNYNGASFFVDEATGGMYDIRRTHKKEKSMRIELTGERREHGKI